MSFITLGGVAREIKAVHSATRLRGPAISQWSDNGMFHKIYVNTLNTFIYSSHGRSTTGYVEWMLKQTLKTHRCENYLPPVYVT